MNYLPNTLPLIIRITFLTIFLVTKIFRLFYLFIDNLVSPFDITDLYFNLPFPILDDIFRLFLVLLNLILVETLPDFDRLTLKDPFLRDDVIPFFLWEGLVRSPIFWLTCRSFCFFYNCKSPFIFNINKYQILNIKREINHKLSISN